LRPDCLEKERIGLVHEASRLVEDGSLATQRVADLDEAHAALQKQFDLAQNVVEDSRRQREQLRAEGAVRQGRLYLLTERLRGLELERARLDREIVASDQQRERWAQELQGLEERQELSKRPNRNRATNSGGSRLSSGTRLQERPTSGVREGQDGEPRNPAHTE
jgi:chromosome segregation ATPase